MSIASEITRLQNAKTTLKTKLNSRNDNQHQITNELIDEYGDFVDSIPSGGSGGIDWSQIGYSSEPQAIQDGFDYAKTIYDNWDSTQTSLSNNFAGDADLIFMPLVDTSNVTTTVGLCSSCKSLLSFPKLNTSNCTRFTRFVTYSLIKEFPQIDTSLGTNFQSMLEYNTHLETIPELNFSSATTLYDPFSQCTALTNFGGCLNLGQAYLTTQSANWSEYTLSLSRANKLTHDSLMNVINNLYDIATKGCNTQQLILGSKNLAKLSAEEISTATNKGWSVS